MRNSSTSAGRCGDGRAALQGLPGADRPATGRPLPEGIRWREDRKRYQIRVLAQDADGTWKERTRTFLTLAEAKKELAKAVAGKDPDGAMTLSQWHQRHWPAIAASVRPATARGYDVAWRLRVPPTLGHVRLEAMTSPLIEAAMVKWSGTPSWTLSPS